MPHTPWSSLTDEQRRRHNRLRMERLRAEQARRNRSRPRVLLMSRAEALRIYEQIKAENAKREAGAR